MEITQQQVNECVNLNFRTNLQCAFTAFDVTKLLRKQFPHEKIFHNYIKPKIQRALHHTFGWAFVKNEVSLDTITGSPSDIDTFVFQYAPSITVDLKEIYVRADGKLEIPRSYLISSELIRNDLVSIVDVTDDVIIINVAKHSDICGNCINEFVDIIYRNATGHYDALTSDIDGRVRIPADIIKPLIGDTVHFFITDTTGSKQNGSVAEYLKIYSVDFRS